MFEFMGLVAGLSNKGSCLTRTLCVTKFIKQEIWFWTHFVVLLKSDLDVQETRVGSEIYLRQCRYELKVSKYNSPLYCLCFENQMVLRSRMKCDVISKCNFDKLKNDSFQIKNSNWFGVWCLFWTTFKVTNRLESGTMQRFTIWRKMGEIFAWNAWLGKIDEISKK